MTQAAVVSNKISSTGFASSITDRQTVTAVITENKITLSGAQSGEYPCRISGNDLFVENSWEYSYNIDTSVTPHELTLTEEWTETYDKVGN